MADLARLPGARDLLARWWKLLWANLVIAQMLRRKLVLDIAIGLGSGFVMANAWWYGFHMPRTNARDAYYDKLEKERAAQQA
ncbi:cytochrome c oxidase subunit 7 [Paramyrothecium foliicola]|nr:cytochrome c oxidase subunit 7 [Paramyrothecium foliicola]